MMRDRGEQHNWKNGFLFLIDNVIVDNNIDWAGAT